MITSHLYPAEKHEIKTTDGYILSLYRIPNVEKRKNGRKSKKVVLFAHGNSFFILSQNFQIIFRSQN